MYRHILVPLDGSPLSDLAVEEGLKLARSVGARVTLLTVVDMYPAMAMASAELTQALADYPKRLREYSQGLLDLAAAKAKKAGVEAQTRLVESAQPFKVIIDTAEQQGADLIVMASHGRRGLSGLVLGSETVKVLTHSTVPVLVCRQAAQ